MAFGSPPQQLYHHRDRAVGGAEDAIIVDVRARAAAEVARHHRVQPRRRAEVTVARAAGGIVREVARGYIAS